MKKLSRHVIFVLVCTRLLLVNGTLQKAQETYDGCGTPEKQCTGDIEGCVEKQNCQFMGASIINSTHFRSIYYERCSVSRLSGDHVKYPYFMGATWNKYTLNKTQNIKKGTKTTACREITHQDFKFFFFWFGHKCPSSPDESLSRVDPVSHVDQCRLQLDNIKGNVVIPSKNNLTYWLSQEGAYSASDEAFLENNRSNTAEMVGKNYAIVEDVLFLTSRANLIFTNSWLLWILSFHAKILFLIR